MSGEWRPFEPSTDETKRIEVERDANRCNLHDDCAAADVKCADKGGRYARDGTKVLYAFHCCTENCEDCFGC